MSEPVVSHLQHCRPWVLCKKSEGLDRVCDQVVQQLRAAVSIGFDHWQGVLDVVDELNTWKPCHVEE